jgi:serine/threonine protein kinase
VQACAALSAAHAAGLVHRDVKPQNLLLGTDGVLKLGDFGIAVAREGTQLTLVGTVLGTAGYLAPEQARGEQVTAAADIYAVGAVLYELLTGEPPRTAVSLADHGAGNGSRPTDVARRVPSVPAELAAIVSACLAFEPEDRPASAAALARRLAPLASEAHTIPLAVDSAQRATEILATPASGGRRRTPRRLAAVAALALAGVAGLVAALVLTSGGHGPSPKRHAVVPPAKGANAVEQAHNLASWLQQQSR